MLFSKNKKKQMESTIENNKENPRKVLVYGVKRARNIMKFIPKDEKVAGYIDMNYKEYNSVFEGKKVFPVEALVHEEYDRIYISSVKHAFEMLNELCSHNVPAEKIIYPIDKKYGKFETIKNTKLGGVLS